LGSRGITAQSVQPGPTEIDMNPDENYPRRAATVAPPGRIEIASLIAYVASTGRVSSLTQHSPSMAAIWAE